MPQLDQLFARPGVPSFGTAQAFSALVVALSPQGAFVVLPSYDRHLRWGPCMPAEAGVAVGDSVSVVLDENGQPWLVGGGAGGGGSSGNIDGGRPDSVYGGTPLIDGNGV